MNLEDKRIRSGCSHGELSDYHRRVLEQADADALREIATWHALVITGGDDYDDARLPELKPARMTEAEKTAVYARARKFRAMQRLADDLG